MDLTTKYLGMTLKNPIVPSASPLSEKLDNIRRLEDAGAPAVVMYSLFEEQITHESQELDHYLNYGCESYAEALDYFPEQWTYKVGPEEYLNRVSRAKMAVDIPVIGSLNGVSRGGWVSYARFMQDAGAEKVLYSAAFKVADQALSMPEDAVTLIYGINHDLYDARRHRLVSAASCTTTALAHMLKPILDNLDDSIIMTASMSTVHAATNSQNVLDQVPKARAKDLRRHRSALNSIILTSTNAAQTLEQVMPEIREVGFMADSVRIPLPTESLIILNLTFQSQIDTLGRSSIDGRLLNRMYREAAVGNQKELLVFSEEQNVPADIVGMRAAVVIEGVETHTRTGFVDVDLTRIPTLDARTLETLETSHIQVPVTHAKIFGWYDNEYGSYTNLLGDLTVHVARMLD